MTSRRCRYTESAQGSRKPFLLQARPLGCGVGHISGCYAVRPTPYNVKCRAYSVKVVVNVMERVKVQLFKNKKGLEVW